MAVTDSMTCGFAPEHLCPANLREDSQVLRFLKQLAQQPEYLPVRTIPFKVGLPNSKLITAIYMGNLIFDDLSKGVHKDNPHPYTITIFKAWQDVQKRLIQDLHARTSHHAYMPPVPKQFALGPTERCDIEALKGLIVYGTQMLDILHHMEPHSKCNADTWLWACVHDIAHIHETVVKACAEEFKLQRWVILEFATPTYRRVTAKPHQQYSWPRTWEHNNICVRRPSEGTKSVVWHQITTERDSRRLRHGEILHRGLYNVHTEHAHQFKGRDWQMVPGDHHITKPEMLPANSRYASSQLYQRQDYNVKNEDTGLYKHSSSIPFMLVPADLTCRFISHQFLPADSELWEMAGDENNKALLIETAEYVPQVEKVDGKLVITRDAKGCDAKLHALQTELATRTNMPAMVLRSYDFVDNIVSAVEQHDGAQEIRQKAEQVKQAHRDTIRQVETKTLDINHPTTYAVKKQMREFIQALQEECQKDPASPLVKALVQVVWLDDESSLWKGPRYRAVKNIKALLMYAVETLPQDHPMGNLRDVHKVMENLVRTLVTKQYPGSQDLDVAGAPAVVKTHEHIMEVLHQAEKKYNVTFPVEEVCGLLTKATAITFTGSMAQSIHQQRSLISICNQLGFDPICAAMDFWKALDTISFAGTNSLMRRARLNRAHIGAIVLDLTEFQVGLHRDEVVAVCDKALQRLNMYIKLVLDDLFILEQKYRHVESVNNLLEYIHFKKMLIVSEGMRAATVAQLRHNVAIALMGIPIQPKSGVIVLALQTKANTLRKRIAMLMPTMLADSGLPNTLYIHKTPAYLNLVDSISQFRLDTLKVFKDTPHLQWTAYMGEGPIIHTQTVHVDTADRPTTTPQNKTTQSVIRSAALAYFTTLQPSMGHANPFLRLVQFLDICQALIASVPRLKNPRIAVEIDRLKDSLTSVLGGLARKTKTYITHYLRVAALPACEHRFRILQYAIIRHLESIPEREVHEIYQGTRMYLCHGTRTAFSKIARIRTRINKLQARVPFTGIQDEEHNAINLLRAEVDQTALTILKTATDEDALVQLENIDCIRNVESKLTELEVERRSHIRYELPFDEGLARQPTPDNNPIDILKHWQPHPSDTIGTTVVLLKHILTRFNALLEDLPKDQQQDTYISLLTFTQITTLLEGFLDKGQKTTPPRKEAFMHLIKHALIQYLNDFTLELDRIVRKHRAVEILPSSESS